MERVAAFVDAGYFWVQLSYLLYGEKRRREDILIDAPRMRESLMNEIHSQFSDCSLLRIYWYDGRDPRGVVTEQHQALARLDDIKMRYGTLNAYGQQKGVDGLLMADLLALAQNRAITSAIILSGDADLAPGVGAAQMLGVRIHRLGINGQNASSPILLAEVDKNIEWPREAIESFVRKAEFQDARIISMPAASYTSVDDEPAPLTDGENASAPLTDAQRHLLDLNATLFVASLSSAERYAVQLNHGIPPELDKRLLFQAKLTMRHFLSPEEKVLLRDLVQNRLDELEGSASLTEEDPAPFPSSFDSFAPLDQQGQTPDTASSAHEETPPPAATPAPVSEPAPSVEGFSTPLTDEGYPDSASKKLLQECASHFLEGLSDDEKAVLRDCPRIPQERDRELLYQARLMLQRHLWPDEKVILRAHVQTLLQGDIQDIESLLAQCADQFMQELAPQEILALKNNYGIPPELDRRLLSISRDALHRPLFDSEKTLLRTLVRQRVDAQNVEA